MCPLCTTTVVLTAASAATATTAVATLSFDLIRHLVAALKLLKELFRRHAEI
jgi:hypothetical protein